MLKIRDYRPGDETGIRRLFQRVFGQPLSLDQWKWKYRLALQKKALPMVAENSAGEIVGHAGALHLCGSHGKRDIPFLQICDVMVDPAERGHLGDRNLYTRMIRQLFHRLAKAFPSALAYGFPGIRPFKLGQYAGVYERIECARETWIAPRKPAPWLLVKAAPLIDQRLDPLWKRLRKHYPLAVRRDQDYLDWRYKNHPTIEYRRVNLFDWGRPSGWVLYRSVAEKSLLIDLLCKPQHLSYYLSAVAHWLATRGEPPAVVWLPESRSAGIADPSMETEVVVTNMIYGFNLSTADVREHLFYTMGDLDIF